MNSRLMYLILVQFFLSTFINSQQRPFTLSEKSFYTKVIRLGSAYTGYAEGIQSINTNTAGLANIDLVTLHYSDSYGGALILPKRPSYSISLVIPTSNNLVFAASYNRLDPDFGKNAEWIHSKIAIHTAVRLSNNFSAGLSINYFRLDNKMNFSTAESAEPIGIIEMDSYALDASIGLLYKVKDPFNWNVPSRLGLGFYLENILGTKENIDVPDILKGQVEERDKFQQIRLGASYEISSGEMQFKDLDFIKMLFVFDAVFNTEKYEFLTWQPNFGIEFTLFEVLSLSYGRENEIKIDDDVYGSTINYPVSRYGIGINLPLQKMFGLEKKVNAEINYCYSDWQKFENQIYTNQKIDTRGLSIGLSWQL